MSDNKEIVVFTLGYQGLNLPTYISTLTTAGVGRVLDVRETPWSHKPGFSKKPLSSALEQAGIGYVHLKCAGNPKENRRTAISTAESMRRYRTILAANVECLQELFEHIQVASELGAPACLTCFEKDPSDCHRTVVTDELRRTHPQLTVIHLQPEEMR